MTTNRSVPDLNLLAARLQFNGLSISPLQAPWAPRQQEPDPAMGTALVGCPLSPYKHCLPFPTSFIPPAQLPRGSDAVLHLKACQGVDYEKDCPQALPSSQVKTVWF